MHSHSVRTSYRKSISVASAEQDITVCTFGPLPPAGMKISTVVFPAHMALNIEWNHIGPLCHNPALSNDAGGAEGTDHMCT